ncbi:response regulator [Paenibacillus cisolokensis]|uniref:response regulator transcription factor n=1 Tax=Paenibacillus cisolokensis TaxID=1658519 RepID=UPI003D2BD1AE
MVYPMLLVDDESVDLEWLKRRVAGCGKRFEVVATANSGFAALRILRERPVDVMISDIRMPIMSGLELAERARELRPELRIVFASGHNDFDYAKRAIRVSASDYLLKPIDDRELGDTLDRLIAALDEAGSGRAGLGGAAHGTAGPGHARLGDVGAANAAATDAGASGRFAHFVPAYRLAATEPAIAALADDGRSAPRDGSDPGMPGRKLIRAIRTYVADRLEEKVTLGQVADHFGFSPNYLGQLYKDETGEHFSDYLIRVRIERACRLLLEPTLKVYEIADRIGYRNILYFNRQFKQRTGMTPGEYRRLHNV